MKKNSPVFIVSTGRSGSKMLAKTLALHPEVLALHEPLPNLTSEAYARWKSAHSEDQILKSVQKKRDALINQIADNQLLYIESSHYCSHLIPQLMKLYNNSRFIHLYRDGRDFVRSGLERNWYKSKKNTWNNLSNIGKQFLLKVLRRKKFIGHSWDDHRLEPPAKYESRIEKISWLWVEINAVILADLKEYEPEFISIKLEEIDSDEIKRIFDFLNLDTMSSNLIKEMMRVSQKKPNKTKEKIVPEFARWEDSKKESFYRIASEMMQTLNYN